MKIKMLPFILLIHALTIRGAQADQMAAGNNAQLQLTAIVDMLNRHEIGQVEILNIPPQILTYARITPEALEKAFDYKLTIRYMEGGIYRQKLIDMLKSVKVQPESEVPDIRWGIIFYDLAERRVGAIYVSGFGDSGAVGDIPVSFKGDLFKWLKKNFSKCFR